MEFDKPPLKCTRVLVTAIFADGSSTVMDVLEPEKFETDIGPASEWMINSADLNRSLVYPVPQDLTVKVRLNQNHQVRTFISPITD